ncbi:F-box only protein 15 isoform X2 [Denticeps clupeoides]|uniref:F-box only protein 15 isoform X2 n=1 Tax=Denticeps clupeoides TaxID=299321 RepID=UPI0010A306AC|nr:F-box only protein 15 isoform X2 [Denticeps clupeoides]
MATGRGQLLATATSSRGRARALSPDMPDAPTRSHQNTRTKHGWTPLEPRGLLSHSKSLKHSENHIKRMPPEILLKIFSYMDAASLFCLTYVNRHFSDLANNNDLWYRLYSQECEKRRRPWKAKEISKVTDGMSGASIQEKPRGYWKRNLGVKWEITVIDNTGKKHTFAHSDVLFTESSITVSWECKDWPFLQKVSCLQIHSVVQMNLGCAAENRPGWKSLIAKIEEKRESWKFFGTSMLVRVQRALHPVSGIILGLWRGSCSVAFMKVNLHLHKLVEKCLLGSLHHPYQLIEERAPFDDVDSEYGLHGYTVHIVLHSMAKCIMSGHFSKLFCRREHIYDGYVPLRLIDKANTSQHTTLSGKINLEWKAEALNGTIENCTVMNLTVLDEAQKPFWCESSPVSLVLSNQGPVCYNYDGPAFVIKYKSSEGKVKMDLVWLEEQGQFFLVNFTVFLSVTKVNKHFGRDY